MQPTLKPFVTLTKSIRSPKIQLVPHAPCASFSIPLSTLEQDLLNNTHFDKLDMSSQDFDFEDIFTYSKPQRKLSRVVEVSLRGRNP